MFCEFASKHGVDRLEAAVNAVQSNIFAMVLEKIWIVNIDKVIGVVERKIVAAGVVAVLRSPLISNPHYFPLCGRVLGATVSMCEASAPLPTEPEEEELDLSKGSAFSKLSFATEPVVDLMAAVPNAKVYLGTMLTQICQSSPPLFQSLVAMLSPKEQSLLKSYMSS